QGRAITPRRTDRTMELITITNANHDELTPDDGVFRTDEDGWSHTLWGYAVKGEGSGTVFHGTYRAGIALRYANAEELRTAILERLIRDIDNVTEYGQSYP